MDLAHVILLSVLALTVLVNYLRFRDALYPAFIHAACWTAVLALYFAHGDIVLPLSGTFFAVVVAGILLFSSGCYVATKGHIPVREPLRNLEFEPKEGYLKLLVWIPLFGLAPFLFTAFVLGQEGPFETFYRNLRFATSDPERVSAGGVWGVWAYLIPISFVSVAVQILLERYRTQRPVFWSSVATALVYAYFATGRTFVTLLIIIAVGLLLITRRVSPLRASVGLLVAGVALFLGLGLLAGKGGSVTYGIEIDVEQLWEIFVVYSLGSLPAFDTYLQMNVDWTWGEHIFRSFFAFLQQLGFDVEVKPLVQEYALVPFPTNVYTVYQPYYTDFALAGLLLMPFAFGYLHGFVYRKATQGHLFCIVLYAFLLYPLVFQFFQDQYFNLLSTWVQYLVLIFFFFYRVRLFRPELAVST